MDVGMPINGPQDENHIHHSVTTTKTTWVTSVNRTYKYHSQYHYAVCTDKKQLL